MIYYRSKNIKYNSRGRLFMRKLNVSIIISIILILALNVVYASNTASTRSSNNLTNETVETNELSEEAIKEARANKVGRCVRRIPMCNIPSWPGTGQLHQVL